MSEGEKKDSVSTGDTAPQRITLLSRGPRLYSTRRLKQAAQDRGHKVRILDTMRFSIGLSEASPELYYGEKVVPSTDAVLPRIGSSITYFGTAVVRQYQQMGVFCANPALGIMQSRDKLRSLQILSRHDIGIPATAFVRDRADVLAAIRRVGGAPVIIKVLEGTQGVGVILAESERIAEAIVETLHSARQNVLIQKFVAESKGKDIRAIVVGDRVIAAMRRRATEGEYRSNVHKGGAPEPVELDPTYIRTAVRATQILGLRIAGVDMLEAADGPQVLEVNSSPGLEGIERATGIDVAGAMIDYIAGQASFPELDVRQRLTVSPGYGVSEFRVIKNSSLAGQTLAETGLRQRDIVVLMLETKGELIPNPDPARKLRVGDKLLCFGKLDEMRALIPRKGPRRKPRKLSQEAIDRAADGANGLPEDARL